MSSIHIFVNHLIKPTYTIHNTHIHHSINIVWVWLFRNAILQALLFKLWTFAFIVRINCKSNICVNLLRAMETILSNNNEPTGMKNSRNKFQYCRWPTTVTLVNFASLQIFIFHFFFRFNCIRKNFQFTRIFHFFLFVVKIFSFFVSIFHLFFSLSLFILICSRYRERIALHNFHEFRLFFAPVPIKNFSCHSNKTQQRTE